MTVTDAAWYEPITEPGHSWRAQNLLEYEADPEPGPSIGGAVYAGKRHLCSGESESGKSWLALAWCIEVLHGGGVCVYVDHEMGRTMTLERLRVLGAADREIPRFRYVDPSEPANQAAPQIADLVDGASLVIIDATIGSLGLHALDENSSTDIERWYQLVVDPLRAAGAAVVVLDHVTKNPETRGKYAIGSQRKVGASDVHLSVEALTPFGRTRVGKAKVIVKKDRPGHLPRPTLGTFTLDPNAAAAFAWETYTGPQVDAAGHVRPTVLMEKVSAYVRDYGPVTKNQVEQGVTGKRDYVRKAIDQLQREGYIAVQEVIGQGGARAEITSIRAFVDDSNEPTSPHLAPPRPDLAPGEVEEVRPTSPRPFKGASVGEVQPGEPETTKFAPLPEPCPSCSAKAGADPYPTAGGTYCCHPCSRGDACPCKYATPHDQADDDEEPW